MLLAAGCGVRMGSLTTDIPKVLLKVGNKALIDYHLENLASAGVTEVILNLHYMPEKIEHHLLHGDHYGLKINTIFEEKLLGMGGGVYNALSFLGDGPFIVVSGDMWTDYNYVNLPNEVNKAHLVMVTNPVFHPKGDFQLKEGKILPSGQHNLNYAGFGVFRAELFTSIGGGAYSITTTLNPAIAAGQVSGEHYKGEWENVNTPAQLQQLRKQYEI